MCKEALTGCQIHSKEFTDYYIKYLCIVSNVLVFKEKSKDYKAT